MLVVYLTSGFDRRLRFGKRKVRLQPAPHWQLVVPYRCAGEIVRALAWFGPREVEDALATAVPRLSDDDIAEPAATRAIMSAWVAEPVSALMVNGRDADPVT